MRDWGGLLLARRFIYPCLCLAICSLLQQKEKMTKPGTRVRRAGSYGKPRRKSRIAQMLEGSDSSSRLIPTTGLEAESMSVREGSETTMTPVESNDRASVVSFSSSFSSSCPPSLLICDVSGDWLSTAVLWNSTIVAYPSPWSHCQSLDLPCRAQYSFECRPPASRFSASQALGAGRLVRDFSGR